MLGLGAGVWGAASLDRMSSKPALTMLPWGAAHPYLRPTASPLCLCFLLFLVFPSAPPFPSPRISADDKGTQTATNSFLHTTKLKGLGESPFGLSPSERPGNNFKY